MIRRNRLAHSCVLLVVAARILCSPDVVIAQASNTDPEPHIVEPIITEETMPNEPGDWDLRFSGSYRWRGTEGSGFLPRTQLFFGIANRWGGEIEVPLAFAKAATNHFGVGDISATVKYLVRKPSVRMPGFVVGLETTFPSGNAAKGLGEGAFEAAPFVATVYASRRVVLQGNFGYSAVHQIRTTDASNEIFYNGAVAFPFERLNTCLVWEINGTHASRGNQVALSPGLKYNLTPDRYLAIAFPTGLNSQTPRLGIVLQLQIALQSAETRTTGLNNVATK
jgi:hypothetical protein